MTSTPPAQYVNGMTYKAGEQPGEGDPDDGVVRGTGFTRWQAMWQTWDDGRVMDVEEWESNDLNNMLKRYAQARTVENVLTLPLNQLKPKITPAMGDRGECAWLKEWLGRPWNQGGMATPLDQILRLMTSAITHKRAAFEKVFGMYLAKQVYEDVQFRPASTIHVIRNPETAVFDGFAQQAVTRAMQEKSGGMPIKIDAKYSFVYFHNTRRDPLNGVSDLEIPYWCYKTQQKILFLMFNWMEQFAQGKVISEASDFGRAQQIAMQVAKAKGGGVIPISNTSGANQKVYTLDVPSQGQEIFMNVIKLLDHWASSCVLAGFVDLTDPSAGGRGSYALSKDQTDFFLMSRQAVADEMAYFVRHYLLADLIFYNFGTDASVPNFDFERLGDREIESSVQLLVGAMASPPGNVPDGFMNLLAAAVAPGLGLDPDKVVAAFEDASYKALRAARAANVPPAGQMAAAVGAPANLGARILQRAQAA